MLHNVDQKALEHASGAVRRFLEGERTPDVAVVLGSGLGAFTMGQERSVSYEELGFPTPRVTGHAGRLYLAEFGERSALLLSGRVHAYEGHDLRDVVLAVRALSCAGVKTFIITCASGGVNVKYEPGDLVVIADHVNMTFRSPLTGVNLTLGPRFPDMTCAYDPELRAIAQAAATELFGGPLCEGVYAMMPGPAYETPAEVRMLRALGVDLAGMSTVPEVIALRHMGARVLGLSCVTNHAAGVVNEPLSHDEVVETAAKASERFRKLLAAVIGRLPKAA